jgi:hypothetical protein
MYAQYGSELPTNLYSYLMVPLCMPNMDIHSLNNYMDLTGFIKKIITFRYSTKDLA